MKKRLMLILAIGVSFTSIGFAGETGQITSNKDIDMRGVKCEAMRDKLLAASSGTATTSTGRDKAAGAK